MRIRSRLSNYSLASVWLLHLVANANVETTMVVAWMPCSSSPLRSRSPSYSSKRMVLLEVKQSSAVSTDDEIHIHINPLLNSIQPSKTVEIFSLVQQLRSQGEEVTSLCVGEPDFPPFPAILEGLKEAIDRIGYPAVIKPIDGNHGKGNTTNITTWEQAVKAFEAARLYGRNVIVEKYITGFDFRILVINYKFICAALRTPASVIGDGKNNIQWLIDETNKDPRRGYGHEKVLTQITIDQFTQKMLDEKGYTLDTVPKKDELVLLKPTANLSTGGTSTDVTDEVHPANIFMCERIAKIIGLDLCGIDIK